MDQVARLETSNELDVNTSLFQKGTDIVTHKIWMKMRTDTKRLWSIQDFVAVAGKQIIRLRLEDLINKGLVEKVKTYPRFYRLAEIK